MKANYIACSLLGSLLGPALVQSQYIQNHDLLEGVARIFKNLEDPQKAPFQYSPSLRKEESQAKGITIQDLCSEDDHTAPIPEDMKAAKSNTKKTQDQGTTTQDISINNKREKDTQTPLAPPSLQNPANILDPAPPCNALPHVIGTQDQGTTTQDLSINNKHEKDTQTPLAPPSLQNPASPFNGCAKAMRTQEITTQDLCSEDDHTDPPALPSLGMQDTTLFALIESIQNQLTHHKDCDTCAAAVLNELLAQQITPEQISAASQYITHHQNLSVINSVFGDQVIAIAIKVSTLIDAYNDDIFYQNMEDAFRKFQEKLDAGYQEAEKLTATIEKEIREAEELTASIEKEIKKAEIPQKRRHQKRAHRENDDKKKTENVLQKPPFRTNTPERNDPKDYYHIAYLN